MSQIDFLIIGAQKAGSTSLFEYMRRHPRVHMPPEKEVSFFNRYYARGAGWYMRTVLAHAPSEAVCGEASVGYMAGTPFADISHNEKPGTSAQPSFSEPLENVVPSRIRGLFPDVKLICVLRDPVARAYSHYQMSVLEGAESRSFDQAVDDLLDPKTALQARVEPTRTNGYAVNGEYHRVLKGFLEMFPRDQLLVIFSDALSNDPTATLSRVFTFIGVDADVVPENLNARYRATATKRRIPGLDLYVWQRAIARSAPLRSLWHRLPDRLRAKVDQGYRVAGYRVTIWNAQRRKVAQNIPAATRAKLIQYFLPDSRALGRLIDLEIPWLADWQDS